MAESRRAPRPPAGVAKRSIVIAGHATSVSLEEPFWRALHGLAETRGVSLPALVAEVDRGRQGQNLSSALRVHVLEALEARLSSAAVPDATAGPAAG
jgi:predicted DNA-binding ribbon-helix-helix protein